MKFSCSVTIEKPLDKVIELFDNPDNMSEWQDGYVGFEHISGTAGEPGAKSRVKYTNMELIETILVRNLPHEFSGLYEHESMTNTMTNRFAAIDGNTTRWNADVEYTQFNGIMIRIMAFFAPFFFRGQVQKWMDQFKAFAERA